MNGDKFLRRPEVLNRNGRGHAKLYTDIKDGLYPPPFKRGRDSLWSEREDDVVRAAIMSGKSQDALREIVRDLVDARKDAYERTVRKHGQPELTA